MLKIPESLPIPFHPSWQVLDSTKMKAYKECPRKFFYEYLLGWRPDTTSIDLKFGEALHESLALIHEKMDLSDETIALSFNEFAHVYGEAFPQSEWGDYAPKNPEGALAALVAYASTYGDDFQHASTKYVEVGGSVPIAFEPTERRMHFRLDTLMEDKKGNFFCREHKTTGGNFSRMWRDDFYLSLQVGTYIHAQYCIFPRERVRGVEINGISLRTLKSGPKIDFERVPCWWTNAQMSQWLWTVNDIWSDIEMELERLASCAAEDAVMCAFPINPSGCTKYRGCTYHDFCISWANPLAHCRQIPPSLSIDFWDPSAKEAKTKMDLEWK